MPKLTLTDFVDIVARSGTRKATKVAGVKNRPAYSPATDFYKPIRDGLADIHKNSKPKSALKDILRTLTDPKKQANYPTIVAGYAKWWGRKTFEWFDPPSSVFTSAGIDVVVNPELGLEFNGRPHVIKLYFKGEPLTKNRITIVTQLMEAELRQNSPEGALMAVLDTRTSKLIPGSAVSPVVTAILQAELAYIAALWPNV